MFDKKTDDAEKHWREVLAQDQQKFELEKRTLGEKFNSEIQEYKAQLASEKVYRENAITKSEEAIAKERSGFEVQKREALKVEKDRHSKNVQQYESKIALRKTEIENGRAEWATKEKELASLLAEKEASLTAAEDKMIDLAASHKQLEEELKRLKYATEKERQFATKTVVNEIRIQLTSESSVERQYLEFGRTARQIHKGKARITRTMCS